MSTFVPPPPASTSLPSRSLGVKFFIVLLLAIVMSISGFFVEGLTSERASVRGIASTPAASSSTGKTETVLGVRLADSFRSIHRSLHYITLFLGLVFLTYFLFEVHTGRRVHPAQYALVGVAQVIFYLLLLSLAEHVGFDVGYLVAGGSTVALFTLNTEWIFGSRKLALRSLAVFMTLYTFIYVLLRVEAYALLVGAVASFAAVAAAMYITRNADWYGIGAPELGVAAASSSAGSKIKESWLD